MSPESSQVLSHYRLLSKIGEGGMGVVWKAEDTILGRIVAIKVLPADVAQDEQRRKMFLDEARLASSLSEAHIVQVHEFGREKDLDFIVMEYVEGKPLSAILHGRPMPADKVAAMGSQVAWALSRAHRKGLLHRDLKPSNLLITTDGDVKVVDFGLATLFSRRDSTTDSQNPTATAPELSRAHPESPRPGRMAGTLPYMSPEQAGGEDLDPRTDIFSLGVVLYEMTTGLRPFAGSTPVELVREIRRCRPTPVHDLVPKVPLELDRIILKAMAAQRGERYQTMEDLAVDLKRLCRELESGSSPSYDDMREALAPERRRRPWLAALAGGALASAIVALFLVARPDFEWWWARSAADVGAERPQSLAVLPLRNTGGDPAQDYLVDGVTEELTTQLAKIGALRVTSPASAMHYKASPKPVEQIARELNVDFVLEGSVLRAGDKVRVTAQLIQVSTDRHLWAESYERPFRDILVLQSDVARSIAKEIRVRLTPQERERLASARPVDPEAHEAYLRGRHYVVKMSMEGNWKRGLSYLEQAIEKDPAFALAHAGMARAYYLGSNIYLPPTEAMPAARAAALKALEIDPTLSEAHTSLAIVQAQYEWNWQAAEASYQRAMELNPSSAFTRQYYALFLAEMGRFDEAVAGIEQARNLDPLSYAIQLDMPFILFIARRYERAVEEAQKAIEMEPQAPAAHAFMGMAYEQLKRYPDAIAALQRATQMGDIAENVAWLGHAYAVSGKTAEARKVLEELEGGAKQRFVPPYALAVVQAGLGETDQTFASLAKACEERSEWLALLRVDPRFDGLRSDPRYAEALRCLGFPS